MKQTATHLIAKELKPIIENLSNGFYRSQKEFTKDWESVFYKAYLLETKNLVDSWYDCKLSIINKIPTTGEQYLNENYEKD